MAPPRKTIGLTLLTLVIVFILFAISWVEYNRAKVNSNITQVKNDFKNINAALALYTVDWNAYPKPDFDQEGYLILPLNLVINKYHPHIPRTNNLDNSKWVFVTYIKQMPNDPFNPKEKSRYHYANIIAINSQDSSKIYEWCDWGYIISSFGPDQVCGYGTAKFDIQHFVVESTLLNNTIYPKCIAPYPLQPSPFTYDPTNGLRSGGDIWRRGP